MEVTEVNKGQNSKYPFGEKYVFQSLCEAVLFNSIKQSAIFKSYWLSQYKILPACFVGHCFWVAVEWKAKQKQENWYYK